MAKIGSAALALTLVMCGTACKNVPATLSASSASPAASAPVASPTATAGIDDRRMVDALIAFARAPTATSIAGVPFAPTVALGLADRIDVTRARDDLRRGDAWVVMPASPWRGRAPGPVTALDLLAQSDAIAVSVGAHPHCASPPVPAPVGFTGHRRVSVQPAHVDTCILWWTVDLFVSEVGQIEAVTVDVWEP